MSWMDFHVSFLVMSESSSSCASMLLTVIAVSAASVWAHPSNMCQQVSPGSQRRYVSNQQEFHTALISPEVGCILLLKSIRLDDSSSAPEGLLFEGKGCIRYDWPFCKHQIMTHKVVISPAPGLEPRQAELHMKGGLYYNTYVEFIGTGTVYLVGLRIFGLYDFSILDVSWAAALFANSNNRSHAASGTHELTFDQPSGFGGNVIATDCLSFGYCGHSAEQLLAVIGSAFFSMFPNSDLETDISAGIVVLHNTSFTTSLQDEYIIDPSIPGRASHVNVSAPMITRLSINVTFQCCEKVECADEDCEMSCRRPTTVEKAVPVQYEGHRYSLVVTPATRTRAQADCAALQGGRLASFDSMAAFYVATRALFTTNDAYVARQLGLPVWLNNTQSPELALHFRSEWVGREMGAEECVVVGIADQLLDVVPCAGKLPYICKSPAEADSVVISSLPVPPSPSSPDQNTGSRDDLDAIYIVVVVCAAVLFLAICGLILRNCTNLKKPCDESLVQITTSENLDKTKDLDLPVVMPTESEGRLLSVYEQHLHNRRTSLEMGPQLPHTDLDTIHTSCTKSRRLSRDVPWPHVQQYLAQLSSAMCEDFAKSVHPNGKPTDSFVCTSLETTQDSVCDGAISMNHGRPENLRQVDGYVIVKDLGEGSYAKCYLAKSLANGGKWAIKVPRDEHTAHQVVQESYFLRMIKHANVVGHQETIVRDGTLTLVTEYCDLGDLNSLMRASKEPFSERFIRHALLQCAMGLSRLHACHIAHRDIKPANILLKSGAVFKIADLGTSCLIVDMEHTTFVGSPLFMAPEVHSGQIQDVQLDIYSLGCVAYVMCMLWYPCVAKDLDSLGRKVQVGSYQPIPTSAFSKDLVDLIHSMLSLDVEKRPTAASICNTQWLFQFCLQDIQSFAGSTGGFEEEVANRLSGHVLDDNMCP